MESSRVVFERTLTELEPLQSSSHLRYMLDDLHGGVRRYGVRITQSMCDRVDEARCAGLCTTLQQCHRLLRFLYENAIMPIHLESVIQDICSQGLLEQLEERDESEYTDE